MTEEIRYYIRFTVVFVLGFMLGVLAVNVNPIQNLQALMVNRMEEAHMLKHANYGPGYAQEDIERYVRRPGYKAEYEKLAPAFARGVGSFVYPNGRGLYRVIEMDIANRALSNGEEGMYSSAPEEKPLEGNRGTMLNSSDESEIWDLYLQHAQAVKKRDIELLNSFLYETVEKEEVLKICKVSRGKSECTEKEMNDAFFAIVQGVQGLSKDKVSIFSDNKQALIISNPVFGLSGDSRTMSWSQILFVKNVSGEWKVLRVMNYKIFEDLAEGDFLESMRDSDKDGLRDKEELCGYGDMYGEACIKTDPNNRDSNGNGFWDGIEEYLDQEVYSAIFY